MLPGSEDDQGTSSVSLEAGAYKVEFITPVNADGSVYKTNGVQNITVNPDTEDILSIDCSLTQVPAEFLKHTNVETTECFARIYVILGAVDQLGSLCETYDRGSQKKERFTH